MAKLQASTQCRILIFDIVTKGKRIIRANRAAHATVHQLTDRMLFELLHHIELHVADRADIKGRATLNC